MVTARAWLVERGLAKEGRGRYSRAAVEALEQARNDGVAFDEPQVSKPASALRQPRTTTTEQVAVAKVKRNEYDPAAVRVWAKGNGIPFPARGRISSDLARQYLDSVGEKAVKREDKPAEVNNFGATPDRVRIEDTWVGKNGKETITKTYRDCCIQCHVSIGWCRCSAPMAIAEDTVTLVRLTGKG